MLVYARIACIWTHSKYMLVNASISTYNISFMLNVSFASTCLRSLHKIDTTKGFFIFVFQTSKASWLVVDLPDHGPGVDVEQGAARARLASPVAHAHGVACVLASMYVTGNGASITSRNKGQLLQNVWQWNNVHNRPRWREIQQLGSNLSRTGPPRFWLGQTVIIHGLNECTLALHQQTSISADSH
jgi:hypothetical protein